MALKLVFLDDKRHSLYLHARYPTALTSCPHLSLVGHMSRVHRVRVSFDTYTGQVDCSPGARDVLRDTVLGVEAISCREEGRPVSVLKLDACATEPANVLLQVPDKRRTSNNGRAPTPAEKLIRVLTSEQTVFTGASSEGRLEAIAAD